MLKIFWLGCCGNFDSTFLSWDVGRFNHHILTHLSSSWKYLEKLLSRLITASFNAFDLNIAQVFPMHCIVGHQHRNHSVPVSSSSVFLCVLLVYRHQWHHVGCMMTYHGSCLNQKAAF